MTKKVIDVLRKYQDLTYDLSGPIDEVIERLTRLKEENTIDSVIILEYETQYGSWGDSDRQVVNVYDRRIETDEEYAERLTKEKDERDRVLAFKRAQLETLKKELGEE
jgi:hypothetical protein